MKVFRMLQNRKVLLLVPKEAVPRLTVKLAEVGTLATVVLQCCSAFCE